MKSCGLLLILLSGLCYCENGNKCSLEGRCSDDMYFPDISEKATAAYQMAVDVTMKNLNMTDYFVEYYDKVEKKGRVDYLYESSDTRKYYYYTDGLEAFEINDLTSTCQERNDTNIPEFMARGMYEWYYSSDKDIIHGPSAMFKIAFEEDRADHNKVAYMGKSKNDVRGFKAQYWRRCLRENLTADYYFSDFSREGVYGQKNLTLIPLRVQIYGEDDEYPKASKTLFPQNYEIMTYAPFLDDPYYTFELPVGMGCGRKTREDDNELPSFGDQSLFIQAEVVYTDNSAATSTSYISDFTFAYDIDSQYLSYFYTPWTSLSADDMEDDDTMNTPIYVVFDRRNKYVYNTTYSDGRCRVGSSKTVIPQYTLPGGNKGYITLTDPSMFYPNDEFHYLGEGMDRGYKVDIFEVAYPDGYSLGDRRVNNAVVTHYYLKADEFKDGPRSVEKALTRIRMSFNGTDSNKKKMNAVLNFNLYGFSTAVDRKERTFYIQRCFRRANNTMFVTIGFDADETQMDQIRDDLPSVVENARSFAREVADIPAARLPRVMVDLKEALYVTFFFLERPPFLLDFSDPKPNTYISGATETEGITLLPDCAFKCLESENNCWGFSHCGASCYLGTGNRSNAKLQQKSGCLYYNRTNLETVPTLKMIRQKLEFAVEKKLYHLTVDKKGGGIITFTPSYIGDAAFGKWDRVFDMFGMETSPRLQKVKIGHKLTGENIGKNFGSLTYGECQRMCLDYKKCETVSYCLSSSECTLSLIHGEDIESTKFVEDRFCSVLSRKYSDAFTRSPGEVLSQSAKKVLNAVDEEGCAKACMKESTFDCLSFDSCQTPAGKMGCRLHAVHVLDLKDKEEAVSKESTCRHYSRKYTYDFKMQSKKKVVGSGVMIATAVTVEQCAKYCVEYNQEECRGFDSCQGKDKEPACIILTQEVSEMKMTNDAMCDHFERLSSISGDKGGRIISNGVAGSVGFLLFVIGCFLGALVVYGISYYRTNRRQ